MEALHRYLLGPAVLVSLFAVGIYFCVRLRLFWLCKPKKCLAAMGGTRDARSVFRAVCLALGGTMGVGNITGVALALTVGGAGAVFWMVATALVATAVKYAEVVLAMDTRERGATGDWVGGAPFYMRGAGRWGKLLPCIFSLLLCLCAIFQGSVIQGNAAAGALSLSLGVSPVFCGSALTLLCLFVLLWLPRKIPTLTSCLLPLATLLYLGMCLAVLIAFRQNLPGAILCIVREAFSVRAGVGGVGGYLLLEGARVGCARGLLSNEAGCGTAPLAHLTAEDTTPCGQGLWGVFEVLLDTVVVCTLTALCCLVTGVPAEGEPLSYVAMVFCSFFGRHAAPMVSLCVLCFALATTLSWAFYGTACLEGAGLGGRGVRTAYLILYAGGVALGGASPAALAFSATDLLLAVMTLLNLLALTKKADRVVSLSASEGFLKLSPKRGYAPEDGRPTRRGAPAHPQTHARKS